MKYILILLTTLFAFNAYGQIKTVDQPYIGPANLLGNPGFEQGKVKWAVSGASFTLTTTTADVGSGKQAAVFNSSAASQYLTSTAVAIPAGLYGRNGEVSCLFRTTATDYKIQAYDGSAVVGEQTIAASSTYTQQILNFIFPSTGNISLRIASASDAADLFIDDCWLGSARNISQVSQATFVGSATWVGTSNCTWGSLTSNVFSDYSADADCTTPTGSNLTGSASAPVTKIPAISFSNLTPGVYRVVALGRFHKSNGADYVASFRLHDGTNPAVGTIAVANSATSVSDSNGVLEGMFSYTTAQSNVTFKIQGRSDDNSSGNAIVANGGQDLTFIVYRFPTSSETALRADTQAQSWSGYHGSDCVFPNTSGSYTNPTADATCTFTERTNKNFGSVTSYLSGGDKLPGIVFTPSTTGTYFVCAMPVMLNGGTAGSTYHTARLTDGTTIISESGTVKSNSGINQQIPLCGLYSATSVATKTLRIETLVASTTCYIDSSYIGTPAIEWSIVKVDTALPKPVLVGSVSSSSAGQERVERASITTLCNVDGACTLASNTPGISGITKTATGKYTVVFPAGTFSAAPSCYMTSNQLHAGQDFSSGAATATAFYFLTSDSSHSAANITYAYVSCHGPK